LEDAFPHLPNREHECEQEKWDETKILGNEIAMAELAVTEHAQEAFIRLPADAREELGEDIVRKVKQEERPEAHGDSEPCSDYAREERFAKVQREHNATDPKQRQKLHSYPRRKAAQQEKTQIDQPGSAKQVGR
jgi:hypothetical protein